MADLTITAADVGFLENNLLEKFTGTAGEAITAGEAVRFDTSNGKVTGANGTAAGEARCCGIAANSAAAGMPVTVIRKGLMDLGDALGDLTYDDDVYLSDTDGTLADAAGTVTLIVGTVVPRENYPSAADKLLRVDL